MVTGWTQWSVLPKSRKIPTKSNIWGFSEILRRSKALDLAVAEEFQLELRPQTTVHIQPTPSDVWVALSA